jgi:hypothetical protein
MQPGGIRERGETSLSGRQRLLHSPRGEQGTAKIEAGRLMRRVALDRARERGSGLIRPVLVEEQQPGKKQRPRLARIGGQHGLADRGGFGPPSGPVMADGLE